jgi:hypothetical protein
MGCCISICADICFVPEKKIICYNVCDGTIITQGGILDWGGEETMCSTIYKTNIGTFPKCPRCGESNVSGIVWRTTEPITISEMFEILGDNVKNWGDIYEKLKDGKYYVSTYYVKNSRKHWARIELLPDQRTETYIQDITLRVNRIKFPLIAST